MQRFRIKLFVLLFLVLLVSIGIAEERKFHARLSGGEVVAQVHTNAYGEANFQLSESSDQMTYKLTLRNIKIKNVTAVHIHQGKHGKNGPPVVSIFYEPKEAAGFGGILSEGAITAKDLIGPLKGKPLGSLMQMIEDKDAYVNVHTDKYPDGEIRGQINP